MIADTAFPTNSPWLCDKDQSVDDLESHWDSFPWCLSDREVDDLITKLNGDSFEDEADLESSLQPAERFWQCSGDLEVLSSTTLSMIEEKDDEFHLCSNADGLFCGLEEVGMAVQHPRAGTSALSSYSSGKDRCIGVGDTEVLKSEETLFRTCRSICSPTVTSMAIKSQTESKRCRMETKVPLVKRRWSSMTFEEQQEAIAQLADIISVQMGVRERLEAIHLINPHCRVSPTDKDFLIDVERITDEQFTALQKFVHTHIVNTSVHNGSCSQGQRLRQRGKSTPSKLCQEQPNKQNKNKPGRRKRTEPKALQAVAKVAQQREKEKRSGYFLHEVWMTVSSYRKPGKEEDDSEHVDILE